MSLHRQHHAHAATRGLRPVDRYRPAVIRGDLLAAEIEAMMPGSNCGQRGFAGCPRLAAAIASGSAPASACPAGGKALALTLARKLGIGIDLAAVVDQGPRIATVAEDICIGCCRCTKVCPTDAILGAAKQIHNVIREACTGCGKCIERCPTEAMAMRPLPVTLQHWIWPKPPEGAAPAPARGQAMGFIERIFRSAAPAWGVHPDDRKRPAADVPLRSLPLPLPERLFMPLQQHVGGPARPIVLVGQKMWKGQMLAEAQGSISAPVHAPTSGHIVAIGEITAPHPSGFGQLAITLASDGADEWGERHPVADPFALAPDEIARITAAAGVVGLGGATFPAAVKFNLGRRLKVATLIVNGGECEPYLSADDCIMRQRAAEVVDGLFATVIAKQVFGGLGQNLFNPAMVARVALLISFPLPMTLWAAPLPLTAPGAPGFMDGLRITLGGLPAALDAVTSATLLGHAKTELSRGVDLLQAFAGVHAPAADLSGVRAGSLGETASVLLAGGGLLLLGLRIITWHIPLAMLAAIALPALALHAIDPGRYLPAGAHLLSGSAVLGAFFIATDCVTSPNTRAGQVIFGAGVGLLTCVIRTWGDYPEGVAFAVLLMNAATPVIDRYVRPRIYGRDRRGRALEIPGEPAP